MVTTISLDAISIKSPCTVSWASMRGDERTRFCSQCRQHVFNISELTRDVAEELIRSKNSQLCVRYYLRPDGTIMSAACTGIVGHWRRLFGIFAGLFFAVFAGVFGWLVWQDRGEDRYDNWARRNEPFRTILNWIDPAPKRTFCMGRVSTPDSTSVP
jgi:hypothetical protein